jgi:hypothetical protein
MDSTISYDIIKALVANPPSLGDHPNVLNLHALQTHFSRALKRIPFPQSRVNILAGFVLTPAMYALINPKFFDLEKLNLPNTSGVPEFLRNLATNGITIIPYKQEQTLKITAIFTCQKNYYNTACNIYHAMYDMLGTHMDNGFKVTPSTTPPPSGGMHLCC